MISCCELRHTYISIMSFVVAQNQRILHKGVHTYVTYDQVSF